MKWYSTFEQRCMDSGDKRAKCNRRGEVGKRDRRHDPRGSED